jgi:4-amino-4-deoxy-L-arabinose transferase-like glycosyltransferase
MFLWLLVFVQWHRLRPLYLPSGLMLFLAIAAPWHLLAAQRNPEWARFYFVHEHWERFTTTAHERGAPFWYFAPVVIFGFFPWTGFLVGALRESLVGGWARRKENADAAFFITWAAFVFLFFSKSQSKLIPYILPLFPPIAVLIGSWLAKRWSEGATARLQLGLRVFAFVCGVLGVLMLAAVLKPGVIRDPEQALALKPFGFALASILFLGGVAAPWAARMGGVTSGVGTLLGTMVGFFLVLLLAAPELQRAGTQELALIARTRVAPGDRVFHYWAFFHDFIYYTERPVGLVSYIDELEVQFIDPAERAARFIDDAELRRQWAGPARVWLVVRKRDQAQPKSIFGDSSFHYHLIAETRAHSLISNQP